MAWSPLSTPSAFRLCILPLSLPLVLAACKEPAPHNPATIATPPVADTSGGGAAQLPGREEFVLRGLRTAAGTRSDLVAGLGQPQRIDAEVIPNRHVPGVLDTIFTVHYDDLTARIHRPGGGGELLSAVEVTSNRHLRYLAIGLSVDAIDEAFGRPDEASDSSLTYYCMTCDAGDDPVRLVVQDGVVKRINFSYYVD